ncbi:hypothetical protein B0O80DRAFT_487616, partial [Mortierella sp. GBAus27b]
MAKHLFFFAFSLVCSPFPSTISPAFSIATCQNTSVDHSSPRYKRRTRPDRTVLESPPSSSIAVRTSLISSTTSKNVDMGDASSPSAHGSLSPQNALRLAENHLKNARMTTDLELATLYLNESRAALSRMEDPKLDTLLSPDFGQDSSLLKDVISVLSELGMMPPGSRQLEMTQGVYEDAEDLSSISEANGSQTPLLDGTAPYTLVTAIPLHIFAENKRPPAIDFKLPECGEDITGTPQLAYCLG